jgi:hypothetical protein
MKTLLIYSVFLFCSHCILYAQDSLSSKRVNPQFWVSVYSNPKLDSSTTKIVSKLYEVKDSSIVISKSSKLSDYYTGKFDVVQFNFNQIKSISYRNRNNIFIGIFAGGLSGLLVGALIGQGEEDDDPSGMFPLTAEEKASGDMILGTAIGIGVGALASFMNVSIPIKGRYNNYAKNKTLLEKKSVKSKYLSGK